MKKAIADAKTAYDTQKPLCDAAKTAWDAAVKAAEPYALKANEERTAESNKILKLFQATDKATSAEKIIDLSQYPSSSSKYEQDQLAKNTDVTTKKGAWDSA